jgi:two-component system alkaline phosphatase synthesis response regulator PhoP
MKKIIFAVEDDAALRELYEYTLENDFKCTCFENGNSFFAEISKGKPDLVLLDIMLPGEDGFAVLSRLKNDKKTADIPVIMVSAKDEELSKVKGLNLGADDYIAKPFGVLELIARVKANLRKKNSRGEKIVFKDIEIDTFKHEISVKGKNIKTTLKEHNLLALLCENAEKVQPREIIFQKVWGDEFLGETRTLDIHIKELRRKLANADAKIKTIRGVGYILT